MLPVFLFYELWKDEVTHCYIPAYGYYADSEKAVVRLFQKLAETVISDGVYDFSVNLYSGDTACLTAFHMIQFGNMSELCIKKLENQYSNADGFDIKALTKKK